MVSHGGKELVDRFEGFYREYYREDVGQLAQRYPNEQRSLWIDWGDLYRFNRDLAEDYLAQPDQLREYAEEALRLYDLPVDVSLGQAHVRIRDLPETKDIGEISARDVNTLVSVQGIVQQATDVEPKVKEAAFECRRCGTLTYIPQADGFQEPHECQGCERQGPFQINYDQSAFVDAQKFVVLESPEDLRNGETPQSIDVHIEDDVTGEVAPGNHVILTGILRIEQQENNGQKSRMFDVFMNGISVESLDEERPTENYVRPAAVPDLETYVKLASNALSTLPENAREEETKAKLITPFVEALGWNKYDSTEVRLEYTDAKTTLRPDYALFGPGSEAPDIVIEAKQFGTLLEEKKGQIYNYLRVFSTEWGVLTNGEEFYIYRQKSEDTLPDKLAILEIDDLLQSNLVHSLKRSKFYED